MFEDVMVGPELVQQLPPDCVPSREGRIQLLEAFNYRWQVQDLNTCGAVNAHHQTVLYQRSPDR